MGATDRTKDKARYTIPALEKGFAILEMFIDDNRPYTISEVSRLLRLPISTTSSLLFTLVHCGYLQRNERREFFLTLKLLSESSKILNRMQLHEVAHQELRKLTAACGLSSFLGVRDGNEIVYIDKIEGTGEIRLSAQIGRRMQMHASGIGKALLAYLPESQAEAIAEATGLPAFTANTITSYSRLREELDRVRAQGYAIDNEETVVGIRGVAAPIFSHSGALLASAGVAGTVFELDERLEETISQVKAMTMSISEKLGYQPSIVTKSLSGGLRRVRQLG
ncbi:MAG: IclR family transcriptional regulator [Acidobacteriota bacterium]